MTAGAVIEDLEIMPYLDAVLLSEEEGVEKPSCEIFRRACERLGVKPWETVHVGDELEGCVALSGCPDARLERGLTYQLLGPVDQGLPRRDDERNAGAVGTPARTRRRRRAEGARGKVRRGPGRSRLVPGSGMGARARSAVKGVDDMRELLRLRRAVIH